MLAIDHPLRDKFTSPSILSTIQVTMCEDDAEILDTFTLI